MRAAGIASRARAARPARRDTTRCLHRWRSRRRTRRNSFRYCSHSSTMPRSRFSRCGPSRKARSARSIVVEQLAGPRREIDDFGSEETRLLDRAHEHAGCCVEVIDRARSFPLRARRRRRNWASRAATGMRHPARESGTRQSPRRRRRGEALRAVDHDRPRRASARARNTAASAGAPTTGRPPISHQRQIAAPRRQQRRGGIRRAPAG